MESGQWLENVDQTHLVLSSDNPVLQQNVFNITMYFLSTSFGCLNSGVSTAESSLQSLRLSKVLFSLQPDDGCIEKVPELFGNDSKTIPVSTLHVTLYILSRFNDLLRALNLVWPRNVNAPLVSSRCSSRGFVAGKTIQESIS